MVKKSIFLTPKGLNIANDLYNKQIMLIEAFKKMGASNEMLDIIKKFFTLISD